MADGSCPVMLSNRSQQAIVGYVLNWEFTNRSGQTRLVSRAFSSITQAMASRDSVQGAYIVPPGQSRLLDLLGDPVEVKNSASIDESQTVLSLVAAMPQKQYSESQTVLRESPSRDEVRDAVAVVISLDGVFFHDGTFSGPNASRFFEQEHSAITAKRDLYREILTRLEAGSSSNSVLDDQITVAAGRVSRSESYEFYRSAAAREIVRMREAQGDDQVVTQMRSAMAMPWPDLRRLA